MPHKALLIYILLTMVLGAGLAGWLVLRLQATRRRRAGVIALAVTIVAALAYHAHAQWDANEQAIAYAKAEIGRLNDQFSAPSIAREAVHHFEHETRRNNEPLVWRGMGATIIFMHFDGASQDSRHPANVHPPEWLIGAQTERGRLFTVKLRPDVGHFYDFAERTRSEFLTAARMHGLRVEPSALAALAGPDA